MPTAVFSVALLLAIFLLGLGILSRTSWIAAVALVFTWAVEREWHSLHFNESHALIALGWYVAFMLLFVSYPFFSDEEESWLPWSIGALSGVLHFWLIYELVSAAYPNFRNGLLPAVFIVPFAFGVWHLIKKRSVVPASGDARLALQGGAALLFLSLIFPIQFEREWITLGWAVEGLALAGAVSQSAEQVVAHRRRRSAHHCLCPAGAESSRPRISQARAGSRSGTGISTLMA